MSRGFSPVLASLVALFTIAPASAADEKKPELDRVQGSWQVVELVEDGKVIPREDIPVLLPSGGRFEVIDEAIVFTSPHDGKRHSREFTIDPTKYPHTIDFKSSGAVTGWGIYRFDDSRLIVCYSHPDESERPGDFAAKAGSKRSLMVLERSGRDRQILIAQTTPARTDTAAPTAAAKILTDTEVSTMLKGTWRYNDGLGALFLIINGDGTFSTVREMLELRLFHKTFVQTPVSSGTWKVEKGELQLHITSSTHADRAGRTIPLNVRSISDKDLIFVDYLGRLSQATKVR